MFCPSESRYLSIIPPTTERSEILRIKNTMVLIHQDVLTNGFRPSLATVLEVVCSPALLHIYTVIEIR